jgi:hypothetical protein
MMASTDARIPSTVITLPRVIVERMDPYHRALAEVLQERGAVKIIEAPEAGKA